MRISRDPAGRVPLIAQGRRGRESERVLRLYGELEEIKTEETHLHRTFTDLSMNGVSPSVELARLRRELRTRKVDKERELYNALLLDLAAEGSLYCFVRNNPVQYTDPSGMLTKAECRAAYYSCLALAGALSLTCPGWGLAAAIACTANHDFCMDNASDAAVVAVAARDLRSKATDANLVRSR